LNDRAKYITENYGMSDLDRVVRGMRIEKSNLTSRMGQPN
jgi:hypothetical protein